MRGGGGGGWGGRGGGDPKYTLRHEDNQSSGSGFLHGVGQLNP